MTAIKHRFFCEDIAAGNLSEEESNHAVKVLRQKENDKIEVFDGKGNFATAEISTIAKKKLTFTVTEIKSLPYPKYSIHIAIAPTKNIDRFVFFLEKCTEIGITEITPLLTKKSERKDLKIEKLNKNLISGAKQSGNLFIPILNPLRDFTEFIKSSSASNHQKFIAHCGTEDEKKELKSMLHADKKVIILIGPEGDFTSEEVTLAKVQGFLPVSLGESRLRTETAGIIACHTVHII